MPPRAARRGGGQQRARGAALRGGVGVGPSLSQAASHITTIGVRRPDYGQGGRVIKVQVNAFWATLPSSHIHHYDVEITPNNLPARMNFDIIKSMQQDVAPQIFTPQAVYDGRKNIFVSHRLKLANKNPDWQEFNVPLAPTNGGPTPKRAPKLFKVKVTWAATINPELLARFVEGKQSHDDEAITAITACNVALRMEPNLNYPFNTRSFFVEALERRDIGAGIELWRGLFQSLRPGIERMFVNVDIATGLMYKRGTLLDLCLDVLGRGTGNPNLLSPRAGLPESERLRVSKFVSGVCIIVSTTGARKRVVRSLTAKGADEQFFDHNGTQMSVAQYWQMQLGRPLRFPKIVCAEVGRNAIIPLEVCTVPPGQIMRKQIPKDKTNDVLEFSKKSPRERFELIRRGVQYLQYGQSQYVRAFGLDVNIAAGPIEASARVLNPPRLNYGAGSKERSIQPRDGAWNMREKRLFRPCPPIRQWAVVVYERQNRFNPQTVDEMISGFTTEARNLGMTFTNARPAVVTWENPGGNIPAQLKNAGVQVFQKTKEGPSLIVVVLPDGGDEIYTAVKHFGDIVQGVATQCLKSNKCYRAKAQYWANVLLKVNVKLGGINTIPDPNAPSALADPANPTIVFGADVIHPAPGAENRPSFTSVVSSLDMNAAKYIARINVQEGREEIIQDLKKMVSECLSSYVGYRTAVEKAQNPKPRRLIFFRDGVGEGQFKEVLEKEVKMVKEALQEQKITDCKITFIIVRKRHHIRFNAQDKDKDRSGNAPAGTVVDREIGHPVEFDFFLLSHGGLLGTSRPSYYSVLYDENGFKADPLQALAFSLCHVYARATRSVSIPAPVYYADIVCARAKTHYEPQNQRFSDSASVGPPGGNALAFFRQHFKPLSAYATRNMYFS